jgi:NAD(P)-dependent dehydrogenase (short-subunit alcohol dehydrogenase family)
VVREAVHKYERLEILVNNAAYQQRRRSIGDIDDAQWDRTFRTNIYAYFYMARAAVAYLRRGAAIVNVGSITGVEGSEHLLDYSATKGAIHAFTKALARNLAGKGIRVNAVAPGAASTKAYEIAPSIVFLASRRDSSYITGEVLSLKGGETTA